MSGPQSFRAIQAKARPTLTQAGTLHKGGPKGSSRRGGWKGGDELPHFRLELDPRWTTLPWNDGTGRTVAAVIQEKLEAIPGWPAPKRLRVRFPFARKRDNIFWRNDAWASKNGSNFCTYRCDGEKMLLETIDGPNGKPMVVKNPTQNGQPKPCAAIQGYDPETGEPIMADKCPNGCTGKLTTSVILIDTGLEMAWTLTTTAVTDFYAFESALSQYDGSLNADGLVFNLVRYEEMIPSSSGGRPTRCWPIKVELDPAASGAFLRRQESQIIQQLQSSPFGESGVNEFAILDGPGFDNFPGDIKTGHTSMGAMAPDPGGPGGATISQLSARERAAEVSAIRKSTGRSADEISRWISQKTSGNGYQRVSTHPGQLTDSDYAELIVYLKGLPQAQPAG